MLLLLPAEPEALASSSSPSNAASPSPSPLRGTELAGDELELDSIWIRSVGNKASGRNPGPNPGPGLGLRAPSDRPRLGQGREPLCHPGGTNAVWGIEVVGFELEDLRG
ncbi:uncharacterized protein CTHT_0039130 [Thermochaetoides thermophila DSM 1495]|uniref:Uncharacterized protein n=1 Tax=Chaetomium thermophilum (strain DSM 1495 / CBS 144.50 / IMI 039719) TaxID=759272 RepID=G0S3W6_CHATD|nr:hypothetical protein CTHT_0039130 [Thermochaetoides thermophila DSM 1495]EGS22028.1 hypothetical protein CTHT_0039130 [Thermochaetoides thermophila DSM 1495]